MPRGGYRKGAGGKPTWKHGKTKVIRVPEALAEQIIQYARKLDEGKIIENKKQSDKVIDLSGMALKSDRGQLIVKLSDLVKRGYEIKPKRFNDIVTASIKSEKYRK